MIDMNVVLHGATALAFGIAFYGVYCCVRSSQQEEDDEVVLMMMKDRDPMTMTQMRDSLKGKINRHQLYASVKRMKKCGELLHKKGGYSLSECGYNKIVATQAEVANTQAA